MGDKVTAIEAGSRVGKSPNAIKRLAQIGRISSNKDDWNRTIVDMEEVQEYYHTLENVRPATRRAGASAQGVASRAGDSYQSSDSPEGNISGSLSLNSHQSNTLNEVINELRSHVATLREERDRVILEVQSLKESLQKERDETRDANSHLKRMHQELWSMMTQRQLEASNLVENKQRHFVDAEPVKEPEKQVKKPPTKFQVKQPKVSSGKIPSAKKVAKAIAKKTGPVKRSK